MNCTKRVLPHLRSSGSRKDHPAIWSLQGDRCTFQDFGALVVGAQKVAADEGLVAGDAVLVLGTPGALLFATIIGLMGLGVTILFVEPWMPVREIEHVIRDVRPKAFIGSRLARLWAVRVRAARRINRWIPLRRIAKFACAGVPACPELDPDTPATITFSSGTTGRPKGLVRTHRCMESLFDMLTGGDPSDRFAEPALCIFPNLALLHLGTGRGAVLGCNNWGDRSMTRLADLAGAARAATIACGPGFLKRLIEFSEERDAFGHLQAFTVGGAQTDCWILERAFDLWPDASWTHMYGGSEAEPVARVDAREAVRQSRSRGSFQALFLGDPVHPLKGLSTPSGLWVSGPNVAQRFGEEPGSDSAQLDEFGDRWHCMGDRVTEDEDGWWYSGRISQPLGEFELEQRIYADLGTSACFLGRDASGRRVLYGEGLTRHTPSAANLRLRFPEVDRIQDVSIVRDRRHRARIDRPATLAQASVGRGSTS